MKPKAIRKPKVRNGAMTYLVISTSLNPESKSRILAREVFAALKEYGSTELVDLRDHKLPLCDGDEAYSHAAVAELSAQIKKADAILLAVPVYNYSVSASAKNLIELTGSAWTDKVVGFLCAAGGKSSYMSVMNLANCLMLDFRCIINPRFVYADGSAFGDSSLSDAEISKRVKELASSTAKLIGRMQVGV
jgi:NAD(P)H-dependent FMN reductase